MKTKRFRIVTNGSLFKVQIERRVLDTWFRWKPCWSDVKHDSGSGETRYFSSEEEARKFILMLQHDHRPFTQVGTEIEV
jgi:hypothetical protein